MISRPLKNCPLHSAAARCIPTLGAEDMTVFFCPIPGQALGKADSTLDLGSNMLESTKMNMDCHRLLARWPALFMGYIPREAWDRGSAGTGGWGLPLATQTGPTGGQCLRAVPCRSKINEITPGYAMISRPMKNCPLIRIGGDTPPPPQYTYCIDTDTQKGGINRA